MKRRMGIGSRMSTRNLIEVLGRMGMSENTVHIFIISYSLMVESTRRKNLNRGKEGIHLRQGRAFKLQRLCQYLNECVVQGFRGLEYCNLIASG